MVSTLEKKITFFTVAMAFLAWMAVKLPMPALPMLPSVFHTGNQIFKISVTLNLIGFSISQLFWGPISDRIGRRPALIYAFLVGIAGTLLAMLAINISMYVIGRFTEGFAVGAAAPIGRALMADKLETLKMAKTYAWYAIAALLPPAVGPVIGGYILVALGWRYIFAFFLVLATAYLLICYWWLPETIEYKIEKIRIGHIVKTIAIIGKSYQFWAYVITYALINGYMIAYYAAMPFWYVVHFHLRENVYAWLAFLPIGSYIIGSMITSRLLTQFHMNTLLLTGNIIAVLVGITMLWLAFTSTPSLIMVNVLITVFSIASGIITPMTNANLMHLFRDKITILSAVMSGVRVGGAGLLVLVSTNISLNTYWPLAGYTLLIALLGLVCYLGFQRLASQPSTS